MKSVTLLWFLIAIPIVFFLFLFIKTVFEDYDSPPKKIEKKSLNHFSVLAIFSFIADSIAITDFFNKNLYLEVFSIRWISHIVVIGLFCLLVFIFINQSRHYFTKKYLLLIYGMGYALLTIIHYLYFGYNLINNSEPGFLEYLGYVVSVLVFGSGSYYMFHVLVNQEALPDKVFENVSFCFFYSNLVFCFIFLFKLVINGAEVGILRRLLMGATYIGFGFFGSFVFFFNKSHWLFKR